MPITVHAMRLRHTAHTALLLALSILVLGCSADRPSGDDDQTSEPATTASSLGIDWFQGDVEAAFAAARRDDKPVFLYWGAEWCPYCKQVKATIFTRRDVIDRTRQYIAVELDGDVPAAQQAGERFGVMGYPTMIVFRPDGTEITRIPNGLNLEAYADVFDLALNALRPTAELAAAAVAGESLADAEWQQLAVYSWGQDNNRALDEGSAREVFAALAKACPQSAGSACVRLALSRLEAEIEDAGDEPLEASVRATGRATIETLFRDDAMVTANLDAVLHAGPEFVSAVTEADSAERHDLAGKWQAVMLRLADDSRLSTVEQFYASYAPIGFMKMRDAEAPVPSDVKTAIRARVDAALDATADPIERHAVVTTAASLLRAAELTDESAVLLEAELADSKQPHYLMSSLASGAEREGDTGAALAWRKRAYDAATGEATRFRWGYGYVSSLIRLDPDALPVIESTTAQLFDELNDPKSAFFGGTQSRAARLGDALLDWADTPEKQAVIERLKARIDAVCATIPAGEAGRDRCEALLAPPPA